MSVKGIASPCDRATGIGRAQHWVDKEKEIVFVSNREFNKLIFFASEKDVNCRNHEFCGYIKAFYKSWDYIDL